MKGHKEVKMANGDEVDAFCARSIYLWKPKTVKLIKRAFNKRVRKKARHQINSQI